MASQPEPETIVDKLEAVIPEGLTRFDAFPKLPSTYKARTDSRGFLTLFVSFLAFLLILNDIGEYIWGWPDYEFSIDAENSSTMDVNVDMVVNMPCGCQSEGSPLPPSGLCAESLSRFECRLEGCCWRPSLPQRWLQEGWGNSNLSISLAVYSRSVRLFSTLDKRHSYKSIRKPFLPIKPLRSPGNPVVSWTPSFAVIPPHSNRPTITALMGAPAAYLGPLL